MTSMTEKFTDVEKSIADLQASQVTLTQSYQTVNTLVDSLCVDTNRGARRSNPNNTPPQAPTSTAANGTPSGIDQGAETGIRSQRDNLDGVEVNGAQTEDEFEQGEFEHGETYEKVSHELKEIKSKFR
ncbi:hypothetical protein ISN44_As12g034040 [Arabidopsis suecica]|uniref:Uncharacterized protein n=1 Tax=Arabidopsis suecica TaxID=45249 RepID=A0A8T1YQE9_ARASU|nr:hypothetical protein ISN44_As12g034040 [Arabidopsis suecica]